MDDDDEDGVKLQHIQYTHTHTNTLHIYINGKRVNSAPCAYTTFMYANANIYYAHL